nr:MAG TPA: Minor capsid protein [Caudoviricetes sp.]
MKFNVRVDLNKPKITNKVTNNKFGLLVSTEWKQLIDPYTPRDTGMLMGASGATVDILPFKIHYKEPYAEVNYYGEGRNFQKKNPFSTDHWDKKAEQAGKKSKLYKTLNAALENGNI